MDSPAPIFLLFIVIVIGFAIFAAYSSRKRRQELETWAATRGLRFSPEKDGTFDERFPEFKCLRQGSHRYAYNTLEGQFQERPFLGFDYHYQTESTDSKGNRHTHHHHFSAVILSSDLPLQPLFIRPESFFDKVTEFFGLDDIDFESAEFSRRFFVKADNKRWAYDILHARSMEFLLSQPPFSIQFAPSCVMAWRSGRFSPEQFEQAALVVHGLLSRIPDYVRAGNPG